MKLKLITIATLSLLALPALADKHRPQPDYRSYGDSDERHYRENQSQYISFDKAADIALRAAGGGYVKDIDFEHKQYRPSYFEVDVQNGRMEHEIKIDAKTGRIIAHKTEYDD